MVRVEHYSPPSMPSTSSKADRDLERSRAEGVPMLSGAAESACAIAPMVTTEDRPFATNTARMNEIAQGGQS